MSGLKSVYLRFGLASLIPIVALSFFLSAALRSTIEERASAAYLSNAQTMFGLMSDKLLIAADFDATVPSNRAVFFDQLLAKAGEPGAVKVRLRSLDGHVVYSTSHGEDGGLPPVTAAARSAMDGKATTQFSNGGPDSIFGDGRRQIELFIPVVLEGRRVGIIEAAGIDPTLLREIESDVARTRLTLGAGLAFLWLALLPIMASVSRRLRRQSQENERLALHDTLTGLPNRNLLDDRLKHGIASARRNGDLVGLLLIDLDRFKEVNDTLGHGKGDMLLEQVSRRLTQAVRSCDTVARLGGDEFAVVVTGHKTPADIEEVAGRITEALTETFDVDGFDVSVEVSIGIAIFPETGEDAEQLLQHADIAMYAAKEAGLDRLSYSADIDSHSLSRLTLAADLRRALSADDGQLVLHFQPAASTTTGRVEVVEALVRWNHPRAGLLPPMDFVPLAEQSGLIHPLTATVLDMAVAQARRWMDDGREMAVAVNLSARNLIDPAIVSQVATTLERHGFPARLLELEVTETGLLANPDVAVRLLDQLRELGVKIALDDFGTGYSSLTYLKRLAPHRVKIDRSFVDAMLHEDTDNHIVTSMVGLAHSLRMEVTAEGVESQEHWLRLEALGCQLVQGFHLARPLPAEALGAWLDARLARV